MTHDVLGTGLLPSRVALQEMICLACLHVIDISLRIGVTTRCWYRDEIYINQIVLESHSFPQSPFNLLRVALCQYKPVQEWNRTKILIWRNTAIVTQAWGNVFEICAFHFTPTKFCAITILPQREFHLLIIDESVNNRSHILTYGSLRTAIYTSSPRREETYTFLI
jgi:hypothetical protein